VITPRNRVPAVAAPTGAATPAGPVASGSRARHQADPSVRGVEPAPKLREPALQAGLHGLQGNVQLGRDAFRREFLEKAQEDHGSIRFGQLRDGLDDLLSPSLPLQELVRRRQRLRNGRTLFPPQSAGVIPEFPSGEVPGHGREPRTERSRPLRSALKRRHPCLLLDVVDSRLIENQRARERPHEIPMRQECLRINHQLSRLH